jgi:hypothetical protein
MKTTANAHGLMNLDLAEKVAFDLERHEALHRKSTRFMGEFSYFYKVTDFAINTMIRPLKPDSRFTNFSLYQLDFKTRQIVLAYLALASI